MISRKKFLYSSTPLLTVPLFLEQCGTHPRLTGPDGADPIQNARSNGMSDPILMAINVGITAPNSHNTQPWKFRIISPLEMILYVDEKRILPVTDPPVRQVHISQGTFLELLSIGASQLGYSAKIELFPEGTYPSIEPGKKPVAHVQLVKDASAPDSLYSMVAERHTNRAEYEGPMISPAELEKVEADAGAGYAKRVAIYGDDMKPYLPLMNSAMELETMTYRLSDETRGWFRFSDREIQEKRDGLGLPDQGVTGFTRWMIETFFLSREPEKFHDPANNKLFLDRYKKKIDSARALYYWSTSSNTIVDWVKTGRDYARFQLAMMKAGLRMHPLSQILQEFPEMDDLRAKFEKISGVSAPAKIQMIVRIGRSDYKYFTPRRSAKDMIV